MALRILAFAVSVGFTVAVVRAWSKRRARPYPDPGRMPDRWTHHPAERA